MKPYNSFSRIKAEKLGCSAVLACLLITVIFIAVLKQTSLPLPLLSLQLSIHTYMPYPTVEESRSRSSTIQPGSEVAGSTLSSQPNKDRNESFVGKEKEMIGLHLYHEEEQRSSMTAGNQFDVLKQVHSEKFEGSQKVAGDGTARLSSDLEESVEENKPADANTEVMDIPLAANENQELNNTIASSSEQQNLKITSRNQVGNHKSATDSQLENYKLRSYPKLNYPLTNSSQIQNDKIKSDIAQEGRLVCDLSEPRSDTCSMLGDVRVLSSSYTILLATSSQIPSSLDNSPQTIRPYARKWEPQSMQNIKELYLKTSPGPQQNLTCNLKHAVPAIIFSTGGFLGNVFHDFTDVLIPLFVTSRQFNGEVQFLVTDFNSKWIGKYRPILLRLSRFEIINMDTDKSIHCFPYVHVGLKSHKVMGIHPSKTPKGYSMTHFKKFLRETFSLKRGSIIKKESRRKPRLLMILRKGSRSIMNEKEIIMMARRIGYKVITARPEDMKELPRFANIVNSCDVMMGVHGAGLANMVFLPENSTVLQIIPWGGLTWACRHDYGEPASDMGINYLEYEIREDESSLIKQYPRDHAVFKDPASIHRQGWNILWSIYLDKQKVKLDVGRFRGMLLEVYQSLKH